MKLPWRSRRRRQQGAVDCARVAELLHHYLDGELDATTIERIELHLHDCRRCGLEVEAYEHIKAVLAEQRSDVPRESVERLTEFGRRLMRGEEPSAEAPRR